MQLPGRGNGSPRLTGLLLVGHGSARHADAGAVARAHADALREHFDQVVVGLLNGRPGIAEALDTLRPGRVDVVPFFMEDGYFTRVAVPKALEQAPRRGLDLISHPPLGVHPGFAEVIRRRIPADLPVLLVGHGSSRSPGRRLAAHDHAEALRGTGRFPLVATAFLEEPPFVAEALAAIGDRPVVVLGLFAQFGTHARDDLPALINTQGRRHKPISLGIIGDDPGLRPLILDLTAKP